MTALLEYLDLLQCLKITVLGHVHLNACNINNSPHKLGFQFSKRAGDQKLRFDLVWPKKKRQMKVMNDFSLVLPSLTGVAIFASLLSHQLSILQGHTKCDITCLLRSSTL